MANKDDDMMTSYDLLKQVLIKKGIPKGKSADDLVETSPRGEMSHSVMFGETEEDVSPVNKDHLVPVPKKMSKIKEDEIALITGRKVRKWILRINEPLRIKWDLCIMLLATWNCFSIPIEIAFEPTVADSPLYLALNSIIDFMFFLDILITFRTTYIKPSTGDEISEPKAIAKQYLRGRFWLDLLSTLPLDLMHGGRESLQWTSLFGLLKTTRVLRLKRISMFINVRDDFILIYFLVLYLHLQGCCWYLVHNFTRVWIPPQDYMLASSEIYEQDDMYLYLHSVYWSVNMLNGNEIGPRRITTLLYVSCALIFGAMVNANIVGSMAVIIQELNKKASRFQEQIDIANTAMKNLNINKDLKSKVINYLLYTQSNRDQQRELETFKELISPSLQMEVTRYMFTDIIKVNSILQTSTTKVIDAFLQNLNTFLFLPEDFIIKQGEERENHG